MTLFEKSLDYYDLKTILFFTKRTYCYKVMKMLFIN